MEELFSASGAGGRDRTDDLPLTKRLLYRLSYAGKFNASLSERALPCKIDLQRPAHYDSRDEAESACDKTK